jgi:hypothetical protein
MTAHDGGCELWCRDCKLTFGTWGDGTPDFDEYYAYISSLILRRRKQMLVHSCIYYRFGTSIISDKQFDEWAYQLVALQQQYPEIAGQVEFAKEFTDFDGTTGFHLPSHGWIADTAHYLISTHKEANKQWMPTKDLEKN